MPLRKQIEAAVKQGYLQEPFTCADVKRWVKEYQIRKDDGTEYKDSSLESLAANSDLQNRPTTNRNTKLLYSRKNSAGVKEYWFGN